MSSDPKIRDGDPDEEGRIEVLNPPAIPAPPSEDEEQPRPRPVDAKAALSGADMVSLMILYKTGNWLRIRMTCEIASSIVRDYEVQTNRDKREVKHPPKPVVLKALKQNFSFLTIDTSEVLTMLVEEAFDGVEISGGVK